MENRPLNVLLLEDLHTDAALIKRQVLKAAPNSVFTIATNRSEFFEKSEWLVPDIVLADYKLPDMNGLEALLHIREKKPFIPFIFISGTLNDEEKVAEAILRGASGYVLKENLQQLPEKLMEVLEKAEALKAAALEEERRRHEAGLLLQKAAAKLRAAAAFTEKEEIISLLDEVLETLQP